ncbi:NADPH-adrenodoxin reductase [Lunasporangiospora selenospora]|uniref:NADPH:adrenodoxin oxidoreductase, mitochondrial n=1 Tax=Lunasporangiospora selenospora TaxID=979761 RepID=A0A9P6FVD6_9FUNG|nr:NADPH-adrenodoxin reductase [Lunasporangiospora selenospora]
MNRLILLRQLHRQTQRHFICPNGPVVALHRFKSVRAFSTSLVRPAAAPQTATSSGVDTEGTTLKEPPVDPAVAAVIRERAEKPFRMAVVGSGPGGFYTAHRILKHLPHSTVDMFEALPVPHGLVRFGVAPDHPEVKNVMTTFDEVAASPNFTFIGNTRVGTYTTPDSPKADLEISDLYPHYDAILLAYGAHEDRLLGVSREQDLKGVMAARTFVGFYNGLPSEQDLDLALSQTETAIVIGQGNVALDVARILLTPLEELKKTDLTDKMVKVLEKSRVKHVHVIGRRGPLEVAFTSKELREMLQLPDTSFYMDKSLLDSEMELAGKSLERPRKRLMGLLEKGAKESKPDQPKSWTLKFLRSPLGFHGDDQGTLKSIDLGINRLEGEAGSRRAVATGDKESLDCGLAFRSIGYKSVGIHGIPFDNRKGVVSNEEGKVIDADKNIVPGMYVSGWLKHGPIGVIASTMAGAYETAHTIMNDWNGGAPMLNDQAKEIASVTPTLATPEEKDISQRSNPLLDLLRARGHKTVSYQDWKKIEQKEFDLGATVGKPREKLLTVEEMLKVLD